MIFRIRADLAQPSPAPHTLGAATLWLDERGCWRPYPVDLFFPTRAGVERRLAEIKPNWKGWKGAAIEQPAWSIEDIDG